MPGPRELAAKVADLKDDLEDEMAESLDDAMEDTTDQVKREIRGNDSVASGELITQTRQYTGPTSMGNLLFTTKIQAPYPYVYTEYGTGIRGGTTRYPDDESFPSPSTLVPPEHIQQYIEQKGITGNYYSAQRENGEPSPLAWAIARSITEFGTDAKPFMRPAWYGSPVGREYVIRQVAAGMQRALRRM